MTEDNSSEYVVPVVSEELHADAIPVETGSVRVVKRVEGHDEVLQQELHKGRVEVRRIKTNRVVDGPQQVQRNGKTMVIPVVSEVLLVQKQWVVTEEIHITQIEERETVEQKVTVNREVAEIERVDENGQVVSSVKDSLRDETGGFNRPVARETEAPKPGRKVLSRSDSMLKK
ncbi:MAG: YsnF/AvaK domain-containing protein [Acidobacteriota bacterium]|nr:YsnF/AvaK domain-containing protein [Acidobacteriota bacterium]